MKNIFITGASSGIGLALVEAFLKKGHRVWAALRKPEMLSLLSNHYPDHLQVLSLDVTSEGEIQKAFELVSAKVDSKEFILVNNAGIAIGGPIESLPMQEWKKVFDVNVMGLVNVTKVFLPLVRRTHGRIINIGSISGRISSPFLAPYTSSKFAVRAISDSLRREMRPLGVKVSLVEPGPIKTAIWEKAINSSMDLKVQLTEEELRVYGEALENLTSAVEDVARNAVPVSRVVEKVMKAVEKENPAPYYLVGKGIHLQAFLAKHLPTRWLDAILSMGYRFHRAKKN